MAKEIITVPDIGGAEDVDVIEICVAPGDAVAAEDSLIVLESDKSSMDIPCTSSGTVLSVLLKEGDKVSQGAAILELDTAGESSSAEPAPAAVASQSETAAPATSASASSAEQEERVPDIGGAEGVDVIEICVAVGDEVNEGDSLIVLESDKSSMEVPASQSGRVASIAIKEGDKVSQGDLVLHLTVEGAAPSAAVTTTSQVSEAPAASVSQEQEIQVPDIGGAEGVDVIEVCVEEGASVKEGDSLIVLETEKASMDVPAEADGVVVRLLLKEGDKASQGTPILVMKTEASVPAPAPVTRAVSEPVSAPQKPASKRPQTTNELHPQVQIGSGDAKVYAGPAARKLARQLGVELDKVNSSGPRGRISKDDIKFFVKDIMQNKPAQNNVASGSGIPSIPEVDFSQFGDVELLKMSKIKKITAANMSRNWLNVPHVTQFDDADISELETFRKSMKAEAEKAGVKLTPMPFILKACAYALRAEPCFNVSMHADGEHIVQKKYIHIGLAVDTPNGLMVPVIRDVDKKGLYELAAEATTLAKKAREGKLMPKDMQGGCFTISSLGPIGGKGFTPIVNAPEVAILGVSKADIKPVWSGSAFEPRQMLPLCLSYDHRAINGADAGRFMTTLVAALSDVRKLLL